MIAFRDETARRLGLDLRVHINKDGVARGVNPIASGRGPAVLGESGLDSRGRFLFADNNGLPRRSQVEAASKQGLGSTD